MMQRWQMQGEENRADSPLAEVWDFMMFVFWGETDHVFCSFSVRKGHTYFICLIF